MLPIPRERNPFTPNSSTASSAHPSAELKPQNGQARLAKLTFRLGVRGIRSARSSAQAVAALSIAGGRYSFCLVDPGAKRRHTPGVSPVRAEKTRVK
jgi:hypothetical protein